MSVYKKSSKFTDYVREHSDNPRAVMDKVEDSIERMQDRNYPIPGGSLFSTFHSMNGTDNKKRKSDSVIKGIFNEYDDDSNEDIDDDFMLDHLGGVRGKSIINDMYRGLSILNKDDELDKRVKNLINNFLEKWVPYPEEGSFVIKRKKAPVIEDLSKSASFNSLDRLVYGKIKEYYPNFSKRAYLNSTPRDIKKKLELI